MPGFDKTGPMGQGSETGRGMGPCGRGTRRGFGRGRGFGRSRGSSLMTKEEEKQLLTEDQKDLIEEIDNIKKRMKELG